MKNVFETTEFPLREAAEDPAWVRQQHARMLYRDCHVTLAGSLFCAVALVLMLWPVVPHGRLLPWLGLFTLVTAARIVMQQLFQRREDASADPEPWIRRFVAGVAVAGCLWGSVSLWMFPVDSVVHQVYIGFVLSGVCAGAVSVYAPLPASFLAFAIPALLPYVIRIVATGTAETSLMAAMVALFVLILNRISRQSSASLDSVFALQTRNAQLTRQLHHRATHDSLVNLINHGEFQRRLERLSADSSRGHRDFALVFLDLDMFKQVNDGAGHAAGDALLQEVATILARHSRSRDTAARVGGDEFALLLEDCPPERALEIAEHIRRDIEGLDTEFGGHAYPVGASIGVTYGQTGLHSAAAVLRAADAACYAAKEAGRNRVRLLPADDMFKTTGRFNIGQFSSESAGTGTHG